MTIHERGERLERENRRLKRWALAIIGAFMLAIDCMGAARKNYAAFDWVSAYGFTLRDERAGDLGGLVYDPKIGPYFLPKGRGWECESANHDGAGN